MRIVAIAGSSSGALVGGACAAGKLADLGDWMMRTPRGAMLRLLDPGLGRPALLTGNRLVRALREVVGAPRIERALRESGDDPALASAAYAIFFRERNRVDFYPDALDGLQRIAARLPVAALTNGNADLAAIGIAGLFRFQLGAREYGAAKPDAGLFHEACHRLGFAPGEILHVGDHPQMDVAGAANAGLRSCWIDRGDHAWPDALPRADLHITTLTALADRLDAGLLFEKAA